LSVLRLLSLSELARLREIIRIMIRYGLDDLVGYLKISPLIAAKDRILLRRAPQSDPRPVRLRKALEELGPTFSKLGQILSTRPDLLPPDMIAELSRLQDQLSPLPFSEIEKILEDAWGTPACEVLASIDPEPIGQATIAQVHRATLKDGTHVAVKIRRPGIVPKVEADLTILSVLADLLEDNLDRSRRYRPREVVREFGRVLRQELDFTQEARNIDRAANHFKDDPDIVIPRYFPDFLSEQVLVLEYLEGVKIDQKERFAEMGTTPERVARTGARAILRQVFEFGFFQGDPHPGNILVMKGGRLGILDFGMFGTLSKSWRALLVDLMTALSESDTVRIVGILRRMNAVPEEVDTLLLESELSRFLEDYVNRPLSEIRVDLLAHELFALSREHALKLPSDLVLLLRALVIMEGIGRQLDPNFNMIEEARPFIAEQFLRKFSIEDLLRNVKISSRTAMRLLSGLPEAAERLLEKAGSGSFRIDFSLRHLDDLIREIDRTGNLLALSILVSSLVIGSALIFSASLSSHSSFKTLGLVGFSGAGILGFFLAIVILRSRRF
jgi:ubiquinone biosynthesis protein